MDRKKNESITNINIHLRYHYYQIYTLPPVRVELRAKHTEHKDNDTQWVRNISITLSYRFSLK